MMGSSNLDHHHHQDNPYASCTSSSSSLAAAGVAAAAPSFFGPAAGGHEWNQNLVLNYGDFMSPPSIGYLQSSQSVDLIKPLSHEVSQIPHHHPFNLQSIQQVGFHWNTNDNAEGQLISNQLQHATRIKDEQLSAGTFTKLSGLVRNSCSDEDFQIQEKLFLRTLASDCQMSSNVPAVGLMLQEPFLSGGRAAAMEFPTAHVLSNLNGGGPHVPTTFSSDSMGIVDPHHHLGLLPSSHILDRSSYETSTGEMSAVIQETMPYGYGLCHLTEQGQASYYHHHKMPSLVSGVTDPGKRGNIDSILGHKSPQIAPKRTRFEQRSSFSPFKVRKEKLGDRIAALQQLVAPFGKTDTASVLMEAIGYIKFLQDQVETLSVPYMRSSGNVKRLKTTQDASNGDGEEPKLDLRSRGLCLVPLSCTSYVTNEHVGGWSPTDYGGSG